MESTVHRSFIRGAGLRRWMARPDAHPLIKAAKNLFDKIYTQKSEDHPMVMPSLDDDDDQHSEDVASAAAQSDMPRFRYRGVTYTRSKTHLGNSGVMFYPNGDLGKLPIPGLIDRIDCKGQGNIQLYIKYNLPSRLKRDPFLQWPEFGAQMWSNKYASSPSKIGLDGIASQMMWFSIDDQYCVVKAVSRVRILSTILWSC
jgi:hypothetical protein